MDFSDSDVSSLSSLSEANNQIDNLDDQLFGGLSKTKQNTAPPAPQSKDLKKKGVSFDEFGTEPQKTFSKSGILKAESSPAVMAAPSPPVKNSLDDFLNDYDDEDLLGGLLSSDESISKSKPNPKAELQPKKSLSEPKIVEKSPSKDFIPPVSTSKDTINFSFSEDDSLLDLKPKKSSSTVIKKPAEKPQDLAKPKSSQIFGAEIPGLFSDDESEFTYTEKTEEISLQKQSQRAVSPPKKGEGKSDNSWLENLLGNKKSDPEQKITEKPVKTTISSKPVSKSILPSEDDDSSFHILQKRKVLQPKKITKAPSSTLIKDSNQLDEINNLNDEIRNLKSQIVDQRQVEIQRRPEVDYKPEVKTDINFQAEQQARFNASLAETARIEEMQKMMERFRESDSEHKEHINRLKSSHYDTIQLQQDEKEAQIRRLKSIHDDELEAFKVASSTTSDVKDLLISVSCATSSLKEIAQRVEESTERASNYSDLITEMTKLKSAIQMERKSFEVERERMTSMVQAMMKFNREQKEHGQNDRFRLENEVQRIETERRFLAEEKQKLESEMELKNRQNLQYKNTLLEEQKKQLEKFSIAKQKIAEEWAEVQNAKQSLFDIVKPDAFAKYEDNIRAAAQASAESKSIRRELEVKERLLDDKKDEITQEKKLLQIERDELTRQKNQLRRDEESIKLRYSDFISDTQEGRTALEAAKRIEARANEKMRDAEHALENLKQERNLLRQERSGLESLQRTDFQFQNPMNDFNLTFNATSDPMNDSINKLILNDPIHNIQLENAELFVPFSFAKY